MTQINQDNYRSFPATANSDLTWLEKQLMPKEWVIDFEQALKMGSLIDAMITEAHKVDYYSYKLEDVQYLKADFDAAIKMKRATRDKRAYENEGKYHFVTHLLENSNFQHISYRPNFEITFEGVTF